MVLNILQDASTDKNKFPCTMCGLCCRYISNIPALIEFDNGFGICIWLIDNLCSIYDNRPEICRVDIMYKKLFSYMDRNTFYLENLKICRIIQNNHGMPINQHVIVHTK